MQTSWPMWEETSWKTKGSLIPHFTPLRLEHCIPTPHQSWRWQPRRTLWLMIPKPITASETTEISEEKNVLVMKDHILRQWEEVKEEKNRENMPECMMQLTLLTKPSMLSKWTLAGLWNWLTATKLFIALHQSSLSKQIKYLRKQSWNKGKTSLDRKKWRKKSWKSFRDLPALTEIQT